ncbi:hypothetical protein KFE25_003693 [Diacronema lutheri]|uniref:Uncharacterized protein n=1 Tax=Diacronema lutheri TaxID=2081491 RepID=A0A8J6C5J7_DIALT|nr:hypothetical protein KFE25_003693 [Diacronema lutheri]
MAGESRTLRRVPRPLFALLADTRVGGDVGLCLHLAARVDDARSVALLAIELARAGRSVNVADSTGATPLHVAAAVGSTLAAQVLLLARADPTARAVDGQTAAEVAAEHGHAQLVALVLRARMLADEPAGAAAPSHPAAKRCALTGIQLAPGADASLGIGPRLCAQAARVMLLCERHAQGATRAMAPHEGPSAAREAEPRGVREHAAAVAAARELAAAEAAGHVDARARALEVANAEARERAAADARTREQAAVAAQAGARGKARAAADAEAHARAGNEARAAADAAAREAQATAHAPSASAARAVAMADDAALAALAAQTVAHAPRSAWLCPRTALGALDGAPGAHADHSSRAAAPRCAERPSHPSERALSTAEHAELDAQAAQLACAVAAATSASTAAANLAAATAEQPRPTSPRGHFVSKLPALMITAAALDACATASVPPPASPTPPVTCEPNTPLARTPLHRAASPTWSRAACAHGRPGRSPASTATATPNNSSPPNPASPARSSPATGRPFARGSTRPAVARERGAGGAWREVGSPLGEGCVRAPRPRDPEGPNARRADADVPGPASLSASRRARGAAAEQDNSDDGCRDTRAMLTTAEPPVETRETRRASSPSSQAPFVRRGAHQQHGQTPREDQLPANGAALRARDGGDWAHRSSHDHHPRLPDARTTPSLPRPTIRDAPACEYAAAASAFADGADGEGTGARARESAAQSRLARASSAPSVNELGAAGALRVAETGADGQPRKPGPALAAALAAERLASMALAGMLGPLSDGSLRCEGRP